MFQQMHQLVSVSMSVIFIPFGLPFPRRSTGMRDDLVFLLDEKLTNIQLCALHMEMRNTEQLLASIGLLPYKVDSLPEANAALKNYGPESFHGDRISVKENTDQQSAISKQNVHVSSMSGKHFPKML